MILHPLLALCGRLVGGFVYRRLVFQEVIFFEFIAVDWKTGLRRLKNRSTENEKSFGAD